MQMKIKEKMIAVVMAFAMMFTFIFAGESSEVIAAAKTKALEINVDFARNAASGDDSGIYVKSLISNKKITFGKTYVFQTKIYVPAVYMKTGRIWVKPAVNFFTGKNGDTYAGMAQSSKEGYSYDKNSKEVKKYGDFYVVNVKIPLDNCDRISASKGSVYGHLFISGFNKAYKGSIYVDDVTLTVDKKSVVKQNYENGKNSGCWYYLNRSEKEYTPAVVSFSGKTLDVTKTSLKKG